MPVKSILRLLPKVNVKQKATLALGGIALVTSIVVSGAAAYMARESTIEVQENSLSALRDARRDELADYLDTIDKDLMLWSQSPITSAALKEFVTSWNSIEGDQRVVLQSAYITENPHPLGEKDKLFNIARGAKTLRSSAPKTSRGVQAFEGCSRLL